MSSTLATYNFRAGDVLYLGTWYLPLEHWALVTDNNTVIENRFGIGVIETKIEDFIKRYQYFNLKKVIRDDTKDLQVVLQRARSLLGNKYSLIDFNCEHFIDYIFDRKPISEQVIIANRFILGAIAGAVATYIIVKLRD